MGSHAVSPPWTRPDRAACWTFVPSRAFPVRTASTSAAESPWAIARARAVSCAAVGRGGADCSSHFSTAVFVVSHFRPTLRPGRSPRCRRSYTVSAETVSNCAVRWTSKTSGQRPVAGAAERIGGRDGGDRASSRLGTERQVVEEQRRNGLHLLQQNPIIYIIIPNIPEVSTGITVRYWTHGDTPPPVPRHPAKILIRKFNFVAQCRREAGRIEIF